MDVRRRARADAAIGAPALEAHEISASERDVLARAGAAQARYAAARLQAARNLEAKLHRRSRPETRQAAAAATRMSLEGFRQAYGLARPAINPQAAMFSVALVLIAALFGASFSATLFADIDPMGWIGGAGKAVDVSLANAALGFLAGYLGLRYLGLRYLGHRQLAVRAAGVAALVARTLAGLGLAAIAAQWRDRAKAPATVERAEAQALVATLAHETCLTRAGKLSDETAAGLNCQDSSAFQVCLTRHDKAFCLRDDSSHACRSAQSKADQAQSAEQASARTYAELEAKDQKARQLAFLPVTTPQALIVLMLEAAVFPFAALKGYSGVEDPYPVFGMLDRAAARAQSNASAVRADARGELEAAIVRAEKALADRIAPLSTALEAQRKASESGASEIAARDARAAADEAGAAIALDRRQDAAARAGPARACFADPPLLRTHLPDMLGGAGALLTETEITLEAARARAGALLLADAAGALEAADSRREAA